MPPNIWEDIQEKVCLLLGNNFAERCFEERFQEQLSLSQKNRIILASFYKQRHADVIELNNRRWNIIIVKKR